MGYLDSLEAEIDASGAASFLAHSEATGAWLSSLSMEASVYNPTDEDCLVAVYVDDAPADPGGVVALDVGSPVPDELDGIGRLVEAANLARNYLGEPDYLLTSGVAVERPAPDAPVDASLTVLTCGTPGIVVAAAPRVAYCNTSEASEQYVGWLADDAFTVSSEF
jgi:hypothetical protein